MFHQYILCFLKCPSPAAQATPELPSWVAWLPKEMGHMLQPCTVYPRCRTPPVPAQGPETGCIADVQPQLLQLTPCSEVLLMHCSFQRGNGQSRLCSHVFKGMQLPLSISQVVFLLPFLVPFLLPFLSLPGPRSKDSHYCPLLEAAMPSVNPCKSSVLSHPSPSLHGSFSLLTCHSAKPC